MGQELERISGKYDAEQVTRALTALALNGGNVNKTARELRQAGFPVVTRTLNRWPNLYPKRYEDVQARVAPQIEAKIVTGLRDIAARASEAEKLAIEKVEKALKAGEVKDPARALQYITTSKAISIDKLLVVTGRPSQVTESRDAAEIVRAIFARVTVLEGEAVEGTAEELPPTT